MSCGNVVPTGLPAQREEFVPGSESSKILIEKADE
jgi:hypothetical protein